MAEALRPIPRPHPQWAAVVARVALTPPAAVAGTTATVLKTWVETGVKPAIDRKGGGVAALRVAASDACRGRNGQKGGRIGEHGRGRGPCCR